jgi:hypothetical protein
MTPTSEFGMAQTLHKLNYTLVYPLESNWQNPAGAKATNLLTETNASFEEFYRV